LSDAPAVAICAAQQLQLNRDNVDVDLPNVFPDGLTTSPVNIIYCKQCLAADVQHSAVNLSSCHGVLLTCWKDMLALAWQTARPHLSACQVSATTDSEQDD
jgi:hypothetical protein